MLTFFIVAEEENEIANGAENAKKVKDPHISLLLQEGT